MDTDRRIDGAFRYNGKQIAHQINASWMQVAMLFHKNSISKTRIPGI